MRVPTGIVAAGVLAALASCGEKPVAKTEAASATSAAPASAPTPTATAWPKRKPGLWTQTMKLETQGGFSRSFRSCIDEATDQKLGLYSDAAGVQCAKGQVSRTADGGWTSTSTCDMGTAGQTQSTVHVTGDFGQRYVMTIDSTTTGAAQPAMNGQHRMTMTAEWSGACPEGWTGGDVEMPGGGRMNLLTKAMAGAG